ncbi:MAG: hypothetical protein IJM80_00655 [Firmicutes bacterium]|nr:hypothetical protein [Bacillota bacterium]
MKKIVIYIVATIVAELLFLFAFRTDDMQSQLSVNIAGVGLIVIITGAFVIHTISGIEKKIEKKE